MFKYNLFFFLAAVAIIIPGRASAFTVFQAKDYTIAGEGVEVFCKLLNEGQPCRIRQEEKSEILSAIKEGKLDLAILPTEQVNSSANVKVFFYTSTEKKSLLVSCPDLSDEKAASVIKAFDGFLKKLVGRIATPALRALVNIPLYQGIDFFAKFDHSYPLHPAVASYFLKELGNPLGIAYSDNHCNHKTGMCMATFDIPVKSYGMSQYVADTGMSIVPFLIDALKSDNHFLVAQSAHALGEIWPHDSAVISPPLQALLSHPDAEVRERAIVALGKLEPVQPETIPLLKAVASEKPVPRPDFSDGSHGMTQQQTFLPQQPIATIAAQTVARLEQEREEALKHSLQKAQTNPRPATQSANREIYSLIEILDAYYKVPPATEQSRETI